jgi:hypothetical protein
MNGLNLHDIVRGAINFNYPDEDLTLYRSTGQTANVKGIKKALYEPPVTVKGQFQAESDAALFYADLAGKNSIIKRLYLYSDESPETRPWGMDRPLARTGDVVVDQFNRQWATIAVTDDFSHTGWVCLRVQLQQTGIELTIKETTDDNAESNS